jgi:isovaleryl-CoA dehydrogenase
MNYFPLTEEQQTWKARVAALAARDIGPRAEEADRAARFPKESLEALRKEGLWGLRVSKAHGGLGADTLTTCLVVEELAKQCPSTAMCYKMHLEACELISRVPTPHQVEHLVKPLANGEVFATVAGGESSGAGDNWVPNALAVSTVTKVPGGYQLDKVRKSYVTSAGQATHYFFICKVGHETPATDLTLLFIAANQVRCEVLEPWYGLGMRGNGSSPMRFSGVVGEEYRIGAEHEAMQLFGGPMLPVLALTYAAAYLGIGSGAYELACQEVTRRYPSGARRLDSPINQRRMAEMSAQLEAARALLHAAASAFDQSRAPSPLPYIQAKVVCSETAVRVTQDLMTMFGGTAFAARLPFERYFRDARAGLVMGLANDQAYERIAAIMFPDDSKR